MRGCALSAPAAAQVPPGPRSLASRSTWWSGCSSRRSPYAARRTASAAAAAPRDGGSGGSAASAAPKHSSNGSSSSSSAAASQPRPAAQHPQEPQLETVDAVDADALAAVDAAQDDVEQLRTELGELRQLLIAQARLVQSQQRNIQQLETAVGQSVVQTSAAAASAAAAQEAAAAAVATPAAPGAAASGGAARSSGPAILGGGAGARSQVLESVMEEEVREGPRHVQQGSTCTARLDSSCGNFHDTHVRCLFASWRPSVLAPTTVHAAPQPPTLRPPLSAPLLAPSRPRPEPTCCCSRRRWGTAACWDCSMRGTTPQHGGMPMQHLTIRTSAPLQHVAACRVQPLHS